MPVTILRPGPGVTLTLHNPWPGENGKYIAHPKDRLDCSLDERVEVFDVIVPHQLDESLASIQQSNGLDWLDTSLDEQTIAQHTYPGADCCCVVQ